jgi:DNA-binding GntR family transcriptional regulator
MPGLRLTIEQAARLWHVDAATCAEALMRLVGEHFLLRTRSGAYVRADQA